MRTIKFRQPIRNKKGIFLEWFYWGYIDGQWIQAAIQQNGLDTRTESQQFTGLKDKNGNEIFEGDLYQVANNKIYEVRYFEMGEMNYELSGGMFVLCVNETNFFPFDEYAIKNGKVIGNIYEHPNLLK